MKAALRGLVTQLGRHRAGIAREATQLMTFGPRGLLQIGGAAIHRVARGIEGAHRAAMQARLAVTARTRRWRMLAGIIEAEIGALSTQDIPSNDAYSPYRVEDNWHWTNSPIVPMFARLRQLRERFESLSSSTERPNLLAASSWPAPTRELFPPAWVCVPILRSV